MEMNPFKPFGQYLEEFFDINLTVNNIIMKSLLKINLVKFTT